MTSRRRPPFCMPTMPWSQPGMTMPAPSENENGSPPRSQEASNFVPSLNRTPEYCMSTVCPAAAFGPLPTLRSL